MVPRILVAPLVGALFASGPAAASPLEDPALSGSAVFTGVTQPHASSILINPAALGLAGIGWHVHLGGDLRIDQYDIARRRIDLASGAEQPDADVSARTMVPGGIFAGYLKSDQVAFGLALSTPMAERFIADQEPLRYHTLGGYHYQFGLDLGVAVSATRDWYFGFGLAFRAEKLRLRFARATALEAGTAGVESDCGGEPCGIEHPAADERYDVRVASEGFESFDWTSPFDLFATSNLALSLGVMRRIPGDWWLAAAYQGPPGLLSNIAIAGEVAVTRAPRDGGGEVAGEAEVDYDLPHTFHLGGRGPVHPDYDLVVDARAQTHHSQDRIDLRLFGGDLGPAGVPEWYPRYLGSTWSLRLQAGLERQVRGQLRWGVRLGWEKRTLAAERISPLWVAGQQLYLGLGGELRLGQSLVLGASYQLGWFPSVDSRGSVFDPLARIACVDGGYDLADCQAAREGRAIPTAAGDYARLQHILALSLRYDVL